MIHRELVHTSACKLNKGDQFVWSFEFIITTPAGLLIASFPGPVNFLSCFSPIPFLCY